MADLARIKGNVRKMVDMGAPEEDIDAYIAEEGVTLDDVRNFKPPEPAVAPVPAQGPSVIADVAASAPSAFARGTADLIGLPGTIGNALDAGGEWVMRKMGLPTRSEVMASHGLDSGSPLSGSSLRGALSTVTDGASDYQPKTVPGKYTRTIGEFLPGALAFGGGTIANAVVPAVTSETAGQLTEGTALEPYARIGGALLGGYAGSKLSQPKTQSVPTAAEIKKSAGYGDQMTDMLRNARTTDQTYANIVRDLWDDVKQAGTSYEVQQNFGRTLQNEARLVQQEGASLHSLERLRRALRSAGGGTLDTPNQAIANRLIDKLDNAVESLSASSIAASGQTGKPVLDVLKEAREIYRTGKKAEIIERAIRNGMDAKSGAENGLRGEFTKILKDVKLMRNFGKAEQNAIRLAAKGNFSSLALRWFGTFGIPVDQGRNFLGSVIGGGVGSAVGGPVGAVALPLAGTAAKLGASRMAQNQAAIAEALVKAGPSGSAALQAGQAARQVAGREAILRALLQSQSAVQVQPARARAR